MYISTDVILSLLYRYVFLERWQRELVGLSIKRNKQVVNKKKQV